MRRRWIVLLGGGLLVGMCSLVGTVTPCPPAGPWPMPPGCGGAAPLSFGPPSFFGPPASSGAPPAPIVTAPALLPPIATASAASPGPAVTGAPPAVSSPAARTAAPAAPPAPAATAPPPLELTLTVTVPYWTTGDVVVGAAGGTSLVKLTPVNEVIYRGTLTLPRGGAYYYASGGGTIREVATARSALEPVVDDVVLDWEGGARRIPSPGFQKSFTLAACDTCDVSTTKGNFVEPMTRAFDDIKAAGANWVNLVALWFIVPDYRGNELRPLYPGEFRSTTGWVGATMRDADLITLINNAHAKGLKVYLVPHVAPEAWGPGVPGKGSLEPTDPDRFFASYKTFVGHYADIAQQTGVEMYSIGNELDSLTLEDQSENATIGKSARWRDVIAAVRSRYKGTLTYSASCSDERRCAPNLVPWWDALDVIGWEWYVPVATAPHQPIATMKQNASRIVANLIQPLAAKFGKPVVLTEIGWEAYPGACAATYGVGPAKGGDRIEQASCYEAVFQAIEGKPFIQGMHVWTWTANLPGTRFPWVLTDSANEVRFSIAEKEIAKWYRRIDP